MKLIQIEMQFLSKLHVAGAINIFYAKIPNINTHIPGFFNCHDKQVCARSESLNKSICSFLIVVSKLLIPKLTYI